MTDAGAARARRPGGGGDGDLPLRPPEPPRDPLEFLSRSWSVASSAADDVSRALAPALASGAAIAEDVAGELDAASGSSFSFASAATSQLVLDRIMAPTSVVRACASFATFFLIHSHNNKKRRKKSGLSYKQKTNPSQPGFSLDFFPADFPSSPSVLHADCYAAAVAASV
jgi:hypothetical protein